MVAYTGKGCCFIYDEEDIPYRLVRKQVKNVTIRITTQGEVVVTIPMRYKKERAEAFVKEKRAWIRKHLENAAQKNVIHLSEITFDEADKEALMHLLEIYFEKFQGYAIAMPAVKFRKMKSRWGSCSKAQGNITLNKALKQVPEELQIYIVVHELAHLVEANHKVGFYRVVADILPEYKQYEERLKQYALQD